MTKTELVKLFTEATGLSTAQAGEYLERLGDIASAELLGGGEVPLPSIGKLAVVTRAARKGRNPQTGEPLDIPARKKVVLKVSKELRESFK